MPTYEYRCKSCGEHLEVVQSFSDDALTECPSCRGALRKVFGNIGITFKGSGFYKNDSRPASKGESSSGGSSSEPSKTGGSSESSGPSAPAGSSSSDSGKSDSGKSDSGKSDSGKSGAKSDPSKTAVAS